MHAGLSHAAGIRCQWGGSMWGSVWQVSKEGTGRKICHAWSRVRLAAASGEPKSSTEAKLEDDGEETSTNRFSLTL